MNSQFTIAVHCLIVLARNPEQVWNSESLSRKVHTHPARIRKIMSVLRKSGLSKRRKVWAAAIGSAVIPAHAHWHESINL
nr:Rrf2 family transcriptional regulator [Sporolactobacillus inulinus]